MSRQEIQMNPSPESNVDASFFNCSPVVSWIICIVFVAVGIVLVPYLLGKIL